MFSTFCFCCCCFCWWWWCCCYCRIWYQNINWHKSKDTKSVGCPTLVILFSFFGVYFIAFSIIYGSKNVLLTFKILVVVEFFNSIFNFYYLRNFFFICVFYLNFFAVPPFILIILKADFYIYKFIPLTLFILFC